MNFQEFWKRLAVELGHQNKYRTLKRSKPFEAVLADSGVIKMTPDSRQVRQVTASQFQGMWEIMKNDIRSERYRNTEKRYYSFWSSSYIME